jgi:RNA polymerase sigma factor (sigma-70 family)
MTSAEQVSHQCGSRERATPRLEASAEGWHVREAALSDFSRIYDAYHGKVLAYAAKLLGRGEADDVAQEFFVKIERSLESLADPSKLASWIHTITLNTVRDAARKRASRPDRSSESLDTGREDGEGDVPISRIPDPARARPKRPRSETR